MNLAADFRTLLIASWLGAALFFSFAVAQSAFAVLPSRELAGMVVNRTLAIVNYSGLIVGLILLATSFVSRQNANRTRLWIEQLSLLLLTSACALGQFVIGAKLRALREQIGRPIDELASSDPLRVAFGNLHVYSVTVLCAALIAAIIVFFLLARRARNNKYR
jgi:NADH:ubiquinone oxidoreductase subunit 6 (subunit J)